MQLDTVSASMRCTARTAAVLCVLLEVSYFANFLAGAVYGLVSVAVENGVFLALDVASKVVNPLLLAAAFAAVEPALEDVIASRSSVRLSPSCPRITACITHCPQNSPLPALCAQRNPFSRTAYHLSLIHI